MIELPIIEFEGKKATPKKGVYKCPFKCGDKRFPTKKWKTEKGFREHMGVCPHRPSLIQRVQDNKEVEKSAFERLKQTVLNSLEHKVGDKIYHIQEYIIKPTHEQRGNRTVRVRYEPVKHWEGLETTITSIHVNDASGIPTIDYIMHNLLVFNGRIKIGDLRSSLKEAQADAKFLTLKDAEYRAQTSSYR